MNKNYKSTANLLTEVNNFGKTLNIFEAASLKNNSKPAPFLILLVPSVITLAVYIVPYFYINYKKSLSYQLFGIPFIYSLQVTLFGKSVISTVVFSNYYVLTDAFENIYFLTLLTNTSCSIYLAYYSVLSFYIF